VPVSPPPESSPSSSSPAPAAVPADSPPLAPGVLAHAGLAAGLAWLVPGLGHLYLRRFARGLVFFLVVMTALVVGYLLQGELYRPQHGKPLSTLATMGAMGVGVPYFILRFGLQYSGDLMGRGYEYGSAFLLTAGLMNWLLAFDAWDIGCGKKE
jgi:hypothetical protein